MATPATLPARSAESALDKKLRDSKAGKIGNMIFAVCLVIGVGYIAFRLVADLGSVHPATVFPFVLLGVALVIALGFEFVNGFHDTANAVATVIYTHSLDPHIAVVWSGVWNFLGVLTSSGTVAYSIVALLPVELILKVSAGAGFSMVFALLIAAILWNLATWYRGLPASSSHTMIGSIIGVGLANQLMHGNTGTSGLDWDQVVKVGKALFFSPRIGFGGAFLLLWLAKKFVTDPRLYKVPEGNQPPPVWIRGLLIATCTGVSFAHGSNDGQKGMGLIMLILVGTVPTAYALNHTVDNASMKEFVTISQKVSDALSHYAEAGASVGDAQPELERYISSKKFEPAVVLALQQEVDAIRNEATQYGSLGGVPAEMQANVRNQMYLTSETLGLMEKQSKQKDAGSEKMAPKLNDADKKSVEDYKKFMDRSTKYIPGWVKVAVALALGLGR